MRHSVYGHDTQHYNTQHNVTQHNNKKCDTQRISKQCNIELHIMPSVVYAECRVKVQCAECRGAF
jgi:hypothetical protein